MDRGANLDPLWGAVGDLAIKVVRSKPSKYNQRLRLIPASPMRNWG